MAINYVKFSRGSSLAWSKITEKDNDTLYFITDSDTQKSSLYLGEKLITSNISQISDLEDILISELKDKQLLVYNEAKSKWENKTIAEAIGVMQGATAEVQGQAGLVPAPAASQQDYFLRGDGTWAQISGSGGPVSSNTQVFETIVAEKESKEEAIIRIVGSTAINKGDIAIIKELISGDKYEYTAYVYNGTDWKAMDGNYSAENVYFNSDFTFTKNVGVIEVGNSGSVVVPAEGKNVKEFLASIFAKETAPNVTQPSVSISLTNAGAKEVGTVLTPSYKVAFNAGSYQYGPATGITATYNVTDTASNSATEANGSFPEMIVADGTNYKANVTATYTEGAIPKSNLGNDYPSSKIAAGSKSASSAAITGYRNAFYGTFTEKKDTLTSADIRSLTPTNKALSAGSTVALNITGNANVMRIVMAYPATLRDLTEVIDKNDSNANIVSAFKPFGNISVEGANGYNAIEYKVFVQDLGSAYDANNVYTFKI